MAIAKHVSLDLVSLDKKTENVPSPDRFFSVGSYSSLSILSTGEFSNVYLGLNIQKERIIIKELKTKRSEIELRALLILEHPHIIKLLDVQTIATKCYLILEYINGVDLLEYINNQPTIPDLETIKHMMFQIITGLEFAHNNGILHGDLKLENIMISNRMIKIIDWGLARMFTPNKDVLEKNIIGSYVYCAPEQFTKPGLLSPASDIWSLGVIFYCLLTCYHPFQAPELTHEEVIENITSMKPNYIHLNVKYHCTFDSIFIQRQKRLSLPKLKELIETL